MTPRNDQLRALAARAPRLVAADFSFGEWTDPERQPDGVIHIGYYTLSPEAVRFVTEMAAVGLVHPSDGPTWAGGQDGQRLLSDPTLS